MIRRRRLIERVNKKNIKAVWLWMLMCFFVSAGGVLFFSGCAGTPEPEPEIAIPDPPPPPQEPKPEPEEIVEEEPKPEPEMQFETRFVKDGVTYGIENYGLPADYEFFVFVTRGEFIIQEYRDQIDWKILDARITDLNRNGFPELFITGKRVLRESEENEHSLDAATTGKAHGKKQLRRTHETEGVLLGWEYSPLDLRTIRPPRFSERQAEAYRGGDSFIFEDREIIREYLSEKGPVTIVYRLNPQGRLEVRD